jgi:ubiquinone/menaquinone biosynthesis C-methylase UbiE
MISQGRATHGIDVSEGLLKEAYRLHPEVPTQLMSLTEITFPNESFDGVWCKAALLHLDRSEVPQALRHFGRILKPNGRIFIQTKEGEGEGEQPAPFDPSLYRHFTFFSVDEMKKLIEAAGFAIQKAYSFNGKTRSGSSRDQGWVVIFAKKEK